MTTVTRYVSHNPHEAESPGSGFPSYEDLCAQIEALTKCLEECLEEIVAGIEELGAEVDDDPTVMMVRAALNGG